MIGQRSAAFRNAKRKLEDVHPEFNQNYRTNKVTKLEYGFEDGNSSQLSSSSDYEFEGPRPRSPIIFKFEKQPGPTPLPPGLEEDLAKGCILDSLNDIHAEMLFGPGDLPEISEPLEHFQNKAISKSLLIDEARIWNKISLVDKMKKRSKNFYDPTENTAKTANAIDLDKNYECLLKIQTQNSLSNSEQHKSDDIELKPQTKAQKKNELMYIAFKKRVVPVLKPVVIIPRITEKELEAFRRKLYR